MRTTDRVKGILPQPLLSVSDAITRVVMLSERKRTISRPVIYALLHQAAISGDLESRYALSTWFLFGRFLPRDHSKAFFLLKSLSRSRLPHAHFDLAICYEKGEGCEKNLTKAYFHYCRSASLGYKNAVVEVERCRYYGIGVTKKTVLKD